MTAQQIADREILYEQGYVINELLRVNESLWDRISNTEECDEVFEWWLLTLLFAGMSIGSVSLCGQTVDVHTHIIIPEYMEVLKAHGAELEETFPLPEWDVEQHIVFMDSADIRTAVLTMPAPQLYYGDTEESSECIRRVNEVSAKVKQDYPGRFKFCAALPLPDVDAAIREAIYALDTLGADGVKLATNSRGQYLGDEELDLSTKVPLQL